jgi:plasmid replication initiation protein
MEKINVSIPTIIKNTEVLKKNKPKYRKEKDAPSSVVIFQHNNLVEARYSLTLQEKRLILWLISKIRPEEEGFKKHELSVQEFMNLLELKGNSNYKELQKVTLGLMKKVLVIKRPEERTLTQVNWINYAHYEEGTGKIQLAFSDVMKPFLLHLKGQFTAIEVTDLMQFKSIHAIRIYELLKQYESIVERVLGIEEIKQCCGVENKFKNYPDFERYLLLIAQKEINNKSDLHFKFERIKKGRKIVSIKFIISKNRDYELRKNPDAQPQKIIRKPALYYQLEEFGFSKRIINTLIKDNNEQTINNAIRCIEIQSTKTLVRNPKAMLLSAIKKQWHPDKYKLKQ